FHLFPDGRNGSGPDEERRDASTDARPGRGARAGAGRVRRGRPRRGHRGRRPRGRRAPEPQPRGAGPEVGAVHARERRRRPRPQARPGHPDDDVARRRGEDGQGPRGVQGVAADRRRAGGRPGRRAPACHRRLHARERRGGLPRPRRGDDAHHQGRGRRPRLRGGAEEVPAGPAQGRRLRGARRWTVTAVVRAGAVAAAGFGLLGRAPAGKPAAALPPATVTIGKETLRDTVEADGELGYGPATSAVNRLGGTVTWLPGSGDVVARGEPLYKIDNDPVVLMYGGTPAYRNLTVGAEGRDVASLERNLSKLGYDGFTVDD